MALDRNRRRIPDATVSRLPVYLRSLSELPPLAEIERMIDAQPNETSEIPESASAPGEQPVTSAGSAADPAQSDAFPAAEQAV